MGINIRKRHILWAGVIVVSLAMLGVAIVQYSRGGSFPLIIGHPLHVTDIHDDKRLAGISHNIWFGQVTSKASQVEDKSDEPYTLYKAMVFESLKGALPAPVSVVQYGVDFTNGTQYRVTGDPDLLVPGKSYLFVTRTNAAGDKPRSCPVWATSSWMWRKAPTRTRFWPATTPTSCVPVSRTRSPIR